MLYRLQFFHQNPQRSNSPVGGQLLQQDYLSLGYQ